MTGRKQILIASTKKKAGHFREGGVRTPCTLPLDPPLQESSDHLPVKLLHYEQMVTAETYPCFNCLIHVKSEFREKTRYFSLRKFSSLVLPRHVMLQHFSMSYCPIFGLCHLFSGRLLERGAALRFITIS